MNYNEGNTLDLDIKENWNIDGFDAVIGNPPYEAQKATGDNKLYLEFINYSIKNLYNNWLHNCFCYILYLKMLGY